MTLAKRPTAAVVLAAGKGTRMKSRRAKVLHEICGLPLLGHIARVAEGLEAERLVVVVGRDADEVKQAYAGQAEFVLQAEQRGTGHAVLVTESKLRDFEGDVFVLYGDTPLLRVETLKRMQQLKSEAGADLVMLTARGDIPGRVKRDAAGRVERIIEAQDATPDELLIEERNTGVYLVDSKLLWAGLDSLEPSNAQGELYITDVVGYAVRQGHAVEALCLEDADECLGINNRAELAEAARLMRRRIVERHMANGVTIIDPDNTYIDATVEIGPDTVIEPGCTLTGASVLGEGVHLKASSYVEESELGDGVVFGPMSHLRPGSRLGAGCKIGNFVEIKKSTLGAASKAAHLTYIGDATIGDGVNFGCGSVVVNYDGYEKHRTVVGDGAFVGCNVNLIAPVEIGDRTFLAAGSTITVDTPVDSLGVARARQRNVEGWRARKEGRALPRPARAATPEAEPGAGRAKHGDEPEARRAKPRKKPGKKPAAGAAGGNRAAKKGSKKKSAGTRSRPAGRKKAVRKKAGRKKASKKKASPKRAAKKSAARKQAAKKRAGKRKAAKKRAR
jgi:bifunctional UDP-N-acetylglucosamine pyrophosphorylase/glucosamine-1-phosphate N-acetyltransferase